MKNYFKYNYIIYIFFSLFLICNMVSFTALHITSNTLMQLVKYTKLVCYIFFGITIIKDWIEGKKVSWILVIFTVLSILVYFYSKDRIMLTYLVIIYSLRSLEINKILKCALIVNFVTFLSITSLSLLGVIPNWDYVVDVSRGVRYDLGFYSPLDTYNFFFIITLLYYYVRKDKITYYEIGGLEVLNLILYKYTIGRTGFILVTLVILLMLLSKGKIINKLFSKDIFKKITKIVSYTLPTLILVCFSVLVVMYHNNSKIAEFANKIITGRIYLTDLAVENYGVSLFGEDITWVGFGSYGHTDTIDYENFKYNYVDNSYARIMFDEGIITLIITIIVITYLLIKSYKKKEFHMWWTLVFILLWAIMEPFLIDLKVNIFVICIIPLFDLYEIKWLKYKNISKILIKND